MMAAGMGVLNSRWSCCCISAIPFPKHIDLLGQIHEGDAMAAQPRVHSLISELCSAKSQSSVDCAV